MHKWYNEPEILPAIGLSDHLSVLATPAVQAKQPNNIIKKTVKHLKTADPSKWWKAVKNLAGYTSDKSFHSVINDNRILEGKDLANAINESFVAVNKSMPLFPNSINNSL
ncbi:Hypothetical predicted protein [Paramuricea clavata]|uniref:Uncharacterized protein n=1 Tax=Paramuricea clavata TaxID=317549 RepID=A0A7D9EK66_PARCT|nr:Hypothetical predicted protein [Paramuricea clavata]